MIVAITGPHPGDFILLWYCRHIRSLSHGPGGLSSWFCTGVFALSLQGHATYRQACNLINFDVISKPIRAYDLT